MTKQIWVSTTGRAGATGSEQNPLRSIQEALNRAEPGTEIMVRAGVYTENVAVRASGTEAAPIRLVSADGAGRAEIRPQTDAIDTLRVMGADHVVIDGFTISSPTRNAVRISSMNDMSDMPRYVTVTGCIIPAGAGDGIKISQGDHIRIIDNRILGSTYEQAIDAVGVHHAVIAGNEISGVRNHAAIQVKGGSMDVTIEGNLIQDCARWGILVGGTTSAGDHRPGSSGFEARDVRVIGNEVRDLGQQAMRIMSAQEVDVTGNWFHGIASQRFIDMVVSPAHPSWQTADVTFDGNGFDRAGWLVVESGGSSLTQGQNGTDGQPPQGWLGAGSAAGGGDGGTVPAPLPPPPVAPPDPDLPMARDDAAATAPGQAVGIALLANDDQFDWRGATVSDPGHGTLRGTGGADVIYTPDAGFVGVDTFQYTLHDGAGHSSTATVRITVGVARAETTAGLGSNVYTVDSPADVVAEAPNQGIDTVRSSIDYRLVANVEHLQLTGTDSIYGIGNALGNVLIGNSGHNVLSGLAGSDTLSGGAGNDRLHGGAGHDRLIGGKGQDSFVFTAPLNGATNVDTIADFSVADDTIRLDDAVFPGLHPGVLAASAFRVGPVALDGDDRIIHNPGNGALFFDADGDGPGAAVRFATLSAGLVALTHADFLIV